MKKHEHDCKNCPIQGRCPIEDAVGNSKKDEKRVDDKLNLEAAMIEKISAFASLAGGEQIIDFLTGNVPIERAAKLDTVATDIVSMILKDKRPPSESILLMLMLNMHLEIELDKAREIMLETINEVDTEEASR